jgi:hypothetical protein
MALVLMSAAVIATYDLDGNAFGGDTRRGYVERYIHSENCRARPQRHGDRARSCVSVLPLVCSLMPLAPVIHMGVPVISLHFAGIAARRRHAASRNGPIKKSH